MFYRLNAYILRPGVGVEEVCYPPERCHVNTGLRCRVEGAKMDVFIDYGVVAEETEHPRKILEALRQADYPYIALAMGEVPWTTALYVHVDGQVYESRLMTTAPH